MIGKLAYFFDVKHRKIVLSNLQIAFAQTKTPDQIRQIAKKTFVNYGQNLLELFSLSLRGSGDLSKFVEVEGRENITQALEAGRGVLMVTMHFGSWEISNLIAAKVLGSSYRLLVKEQTKNHRLASLLDALRLEGGANVVQRGMGTRELLKSLKNNEVVAMVADQGAKEGVMVPFFGKQASMASGAVRIALKFNVPICFIRIVRKSGKYHKVTIDKPLNLLVTDNEQQDILINLKKITAVMEKYIEQDPAEYMWFYKIWKYSKESVAAIITDGKAGHLRQSEAVASLLKSALHDRGINTQVPIFQVTFKNDFCARLFALMASIFSQAGRLAFLRLCLKEASFKQLLSIKPDFIVSCGSSVAGVNYLLSREFNAKNIVILKPGIIKLRHFNLVILPRHDTIKRKFWPANVITTQGAPNLITPHYLQDQKLKLLNRYSHLKNGDNFKIGVLLGGDTDEFILSEQRVRVLVHQLMETADEAQADILFTTSRRTSPKVENLLMRELSKYRRCRLLIIANRENIPEAVGGILALAEVIIVSGDSISMVSEAASAGKKVAAFFVEHRGGVPFEQTKHGRFLEQLSSDGYVLSADVKYMRESLYKLIKNKVQIKELDDATVILESLRKII